MSWGPLLLELQSFLDPLSQKMLGSWVQLFLAPGLSASLRCLYICPALFI